MPRYLAHAVIDGTGIHRNAIAELRHDGSVIIEPFVCETHSTIFVSGFVAVVSESAITEVHRSALMAIASGDPATAPYDIADYIQKNGLYVKPAETPCLLVLER